jgi:hypothetical protein
MGDFAVILHGRATTHREWITCVIERRAPREQSVSCDLSQVLTLRGFGGSERRRMRVARPHDK